MNTNKFPKAKLPKVTIFAKDGYDEKFNNTYDLEEDFFAINKAANDLMTAMQEGWWGEMYDERNGVIIARF